MNDILAIVGRDYADLPTVRTLSLTCKWLNEYLNRPHIKEKILARCIVKKHNPLYFGWRDRFDYGDELASMEILRTGIIKTCPPSYFKLLAAAEKEVAAEKRMAELRAKERSVRHKNRMRKRK